MDTNVPSGTLVSPDQSGSDPMEAALFRRVTLRFIPFLMVCYFVCYLSRVNLGFAALQMNGDLRLRPDRLWSRCRSLLPYLLCMRDSVQFDAP